MSNVVEVVVGVVRGVVVVGGARATNTQSKQVGNAIYRQKSAEAGGACSLFFADFVW